MSIKARQLRGTLAVGMLRPAHGLRKHLNQLLFLAEKNAEKIFPNRIVCPEKKWKGYCESLSQRLYRKAGSTDASPHTSGLEGHEPTIDQLPAIMIRTAEYLTTFLKCLNAYPSPDTIELRSALALAARDIRVSVYNSVGDNANRFGSIGHCV